MLAAKVCTGRASCLVAGRSTGPDDRHHEGDERRRGAGDDEEDGAPFLVQGHPRTSPGTLLDWVGAIADDGYGRFYLDGTSVRPHRYSLALDLGLTLELLPELMHECDVPLCVNPRHLGMGDRQSNMVDRQRKLRSANGSGLRFRGLPRAAMAARSRALREDLLAHGWDAQRIHAINAGSRAEDPTLF